jgi:sigma-E factor negative regulatory protein RseB
MSRLGVHRLSVRALGLPMLGLALWAALSATGAIAQTPGGFTAGPSAPPPSLNQWLDRLQEAARRRAYIGTFVVSAGSAMSASKIWHVCDGTQQMERIDSLTGTARTTLRKNDEVLTLVPESRVAWAEKREALRPFPDQIKTPGNAIEEHYTLRLLGVERVAGFDADVLHIQPRDALRFGYRVWSEKQTGLTVKMQTLDGQGQVIEQMVFSELQLDAPVKMETLARQMAKTQGYKILRPQLNKTTADAQGWRLKQEVPGFLPMSSHTRGDPAAAPGSLPLQWVFSDGLSSVSLFVEPYDAQRHRREGASAMGATHSLTRRLGDHWLTAMGEVPPATLREFAQSLERLR